MAHDDMLFRGTATATGAINFSQIKGPSTIRAGYGKARLKSVRAFWNATDPDTDVDVLIDYKNTNWTRSNKLHAAHWGTLTAQARNTYGVVDCHSFEVLMNSAFIISGNVSGTIDTGDTVTVDVIVTVDYDAVPSINPDQYAGCPITFGVTQAAAVSGAAGTQIRLGSYDVLDPGIVYALNEVSTTNTALGMAYLVFEGIQTQRGLSRILPLPAGPDGIVPTILGSVEFTKQSFELSVISDTTISGQTIPIYMEMLASANSIGA